MSGLLTRTFAPVVPSTCKAVKVFNAVDMRGPIGFAHGIECIAKFNSLEVEKVGFQFPCLRK